MREIGTLPSERDALLFRDMLYLRGIESDIEHAGDGACEIWVHDDDQLEEAKGLMDNYLAGMDAADAEAAGASAARQRREAELRDQRRSSRVITRERLGYDRMAPAGFTTVPLVLAILSLLATLWAGDFGIASAGRESGTEAGQLAKLERQNMLFITKFGVLSDAVRKQIEIRAEAIDREVRSSASGSQEEIEKLVEEALARAHLVKWWDRSLPEIRHGQVWRLFTPMFIHFGILHLIFNLMWLRDLGGFMEMRFGALCVVVFVLASAALSNVAQFYMSGPRFGGLSGVNYAFFGFLWSRQKCDRTVAWQMNPQVAFLMFAWLVICMTGAMGSVANTAHVAGLVCGLGWGYISGRHASRR